MRPLWLVLLISFNAHAGYVELSTSASYRKSFVNADNYSVTQSATGAFAYYFLEMSAIEFSYTEGVNTQYGQAILAGALRSYVQTINFRLTGADIIISFAGRQAPVQPYVKVGAAYVVKNYKIITDVTDPVTFESKGVAPTAGLGFRIMITQNFAFKIGVDAWSSPPTAEGKDVPYDMAGKAGISWLF